MNIDRQIFDRIDKIKWFINCGVQLNQYEIKYRIVCVNSWEHAKEWYSNDHWEQTTLEARNTLTKFLHDMYPNKYIEWNKYAREAKEFIESSLSAKLGFYKEQQNLDNIFVDCVKWDILHAIMESHYVQLKNAPIFFLDLLSIYEKGNFPCGWDGDFPRDGGLVVY